MTKTALFMLFALLVGNSASSEDVASRVVDRGGSPCAIAACAEGPCIAYGQGRALKLALKDVTGWVVETVGAPCGDYGCSTVDLAISESGEVAIVTHVTYEGGVITGRIVVTRSTPAGWVEETVDLFGSSPSIAWVQGERWINRTTSEVEKIQRPAIAYSRTDSPGTQLRYAYREPDGTWDVEVVEATTERDLYGLKRRRVFWPSLAVDSDGVPAIAYGWSLSRCDGYKSCDQIRYTWLAADGTWPYQVAVKTIQSALRLDYTDAGEPSLAYVAGTGPNVVSRIAGVWSNTFLQWPGSGRAGSIDFDAAVLTEYDSGGGDLWMHRGEWSRIASAGVVGYSNSMYVDESGAAHVCFSDQTQGVLRYMEVLP